MTKSFTTKQSSIHGKGAFATRDFKRGDIIFIFKGRVYKRNNRNISDTFANPDSIGIGKNEWIDPVGNFHYINHSCDPNMGIKGRVTFIALKNIKKNDELTFDYSITEADPNWRMKCKCGSKNCRKVIRSVQFIPPAIYKHYMPFIPKFAQGVYNISHK